MRISKFYPAKYMLCLKFPRHPKTAFSVFLSRGLVHNRTEDRRRRACIPRCQRTNQGNAESSLCGFFTESIRGLLLPVGWARMVENEKTRSHSNSLRARTTVPSSICRDKVRNVTKSDTRRAKLQSPKAQQKQNLR